MARRKKINMIDSVKLIERFNIFIWTLRTVDVSLKLGVQLNITAAIRYLGQPLQQKHVQQVRRQNRAFIRRRDN